MNVILILAAMAAAGALLVAGLAHLLSKAPGWEPQRRFVIVALTAGLYPAWTVIEGKSVDPQLCTLMSQLQIATASIHVAAWGAYLDVLLGTKPSRPIFAYRALLIALAGIILVPGAAFTGRVDVRTLSGLTYVDPEPTLLGGMLFALIILAVAGLCVRLGAAARRGVPRAVAYLIALATLGLMGVNDTLVSSGLIPGIYLLEFAFFAPIATVAFHLTSRFIEDARSLTELRTRLEALVDERTQELTRSQQALVRTESLAAIGRVAASVAHEVNNPMTAVIANAHFLRETFARTGSLPPNGLECLTRTENAAVRVTTITRQLLDAGRLAAATERADLQPVSVTEVLRDALHVAAARCTTVSVSASLSEELWIQAHAPSLAQVLVNLIINGADAIAESGRGGRVTVSGRGLGPLVRLTVADDGPGMSAEVLARATEAFFTTKPLGRGTGLGLTLSSSLVRGMGGELRFESAPGEGTRVHVELPAATQPAATQPAAGAHTTARRRLLVIDDDVVVRESLGHMLSLRHDVRVAASVVDARQALTGDPEVDLIVCDLGMPDGGGERLALELARDAPALARRLVFMTAGAGDEVANRHRVLRKPLDLLELEKALAQVGAARRTAS